MAKKLKIKRRKPKKTLRVVRTKKYLRVASKKLKKGKKKPRVRLISKNNLSQIKLKAQKVREIYDLYSQKISGLAAQQNKAIEDFLNKLRAKKIEELKRKI